MNIYIGINIDLFLIMNLIIRNLFYIFVFSLAPKIYVGQTLNIVFPKFAGNTYEFIIFQGGKTIKIIEDSIPPNGKIQLTIPKKYHPYTGMGRWLLTNTSKGGGLDLVLPGYGYQILCYDTLPNENNIIVKGYNHFNTLANLNRIQVRWIQKYECMQMALKIYEQNEPLYSKFIVESKHIEEEYGFFMDSMLNKNDFVYSFFQISNISKGIPHVLSTNPDVQALNVHFYITNHLNFNHLYTSGHWDRIIFSWCDLQTTHFNSIDSFLNSFHKIEKRIISPEIFTEFVISTTKYLLYHKKDSFIEALTPIITNSKKITSFKNHLNVYKKAIIGNSAPELILPNTNQSSSFSIAPSNLIDSSTDKAILLFYESGCGSCQSLIQELNTRYKTLKEQKIDIISIAADVNQNLFYNNASAFIWKNKYCDFKGMQGINFENYGVIATPMMFLIDKNNKIISKLTHLNNILKP